jgi:hypothetical protein
MIAFTYKWLKNTVSAYSSRGLHQLGHCIIRAAIVGAKNATLF